MYRKLPGLALDDGLIAPTRTSRLPGLAARRPVPGDKALVSSSSASNAPCLGGPAGRLTSSDVLDLQRSIGNRAVGHLLQRYTEIKDGDEKFPAKFKSRTFLSDKKLEGDQGFFVHQDQVKHEDQETSSFFAQGEKVQPNLVSSSNAPLLMADNLDLAIESTSGEPKQFFASRARVSEGNQLLKGKVQLVTTDRYLAIRGAQKVSKLFEVVPKVGKQKQQGLAVTTPQNCNEMAAFVTGKSLPDTNATRQAEELIASVLDDVTKEGWADKRYLLYEKVGSNEGTTRYVEFLDVLVRRFKEIVDDVEGGGSEAIERSMRTRIANSALDPALGSIITTVGLATQEDEERAGRGEDTYFSYHFASVVAKSGTDYVTMENYARRDKRVTNTQSSGDPLFFFKMYGKKEPRQTWHEKQVSSGGFRGAIVSFEVR